MHVRLLGPVDAVVDGEPRPVPGLRRKAILATLALHPATVVSLDQLADVVWGDAVPSAPRATLQRHVSYLRAVLGGATVIRAQPPGYVLEADCGTDAGHAEQLLLQGRRAAAPEAAAGYLTAARALWRGPSLADVAGGPWLDAQAQRLDLLHTQVSRAWADARLAAGDHQALVPELERLAADDPLDEHVAAQLMLALYRSGQQAGALAACRRARRTLAAELGAGPGPRLRELEAAILRHDPGLDSPGRLGAGPGTGRPPPGPARPGPGAPGALEPGGRPPAAAPTGPAPLHRPGPGRLIPAQLPPGPAFAGRRAELARLTAVLAPPQRRSGAGVPSGLASAIAVVSGTAGIGKTTLAVHWARRAAGRFPDGQLFASLHGFGVAGAAADPGDVLRGFLEALGWPPASIPADQAGRVALYRSALAGQQLLVVLDDARDARQVRPLLPGAPGCAVIITSRSQLTGLVAAEGARSLTLDVLSTAEARDLLRTRLGSGRVSRELAAADAIITRCARLPLALTVAAARVTTTGLPLEAIAGELRASAPALDAFDSGDPATDVRSVLSWSYQALRADAARLFRLLGLHPGPDWPVAAAASLAAAGPGPARRLLAELAGAHLLAEHRPGRYTCHDLLRAYAAEQVQAADRPADRLAAIRRLADHYLGSAYRAVLLIEPHTDPLDLPPAAPGTELAEAATVADAMAWLAAEQAGILAMVRLAAATGLTRHAWQLAWLVSSALLRGGAWADHALVQEIARHAARQAGDVSGQAHAAHALALGYARSGRFAAAEPLFAEAMALFESAGDRIGQAGVHSILTWIAEHHDRLADALGHATRALELYQAAGRGAVATALNDVGFCHARLGHYEQARQYCQRGLDLARASGERNCAAAALDSLGLVHDGLGQHGLAVACYQQAADCYRDLGDRFNEADTLVSLGDSEQRAGQLAAARTRWAAALVILDEIGHPDAGRVRSRLAGSSQALAAGLADGQ
jgi:DNA-binding SARP family transcriptional activator/tetratricopeptide (TPR) repeat protein